ncbi:hypothetical protein JJQ72_18545 [Paenibacillus sp. F411]|uniref:DUF6881 domain-containing protein n=1 Tax=Paenibacillus sp. F411 TaxID=2820239 RepID=UPI001AAF546A|nr:hypothetical protein [Paenibacillus sp. F411]MBO2945983.1 hypothetical protein [Paenibacillus sp. F411]
MQFLKIEWIHEIADEPYIIYAELDDVGYENRKIEIYKNGRIGYATQSSEFGGSILSEQPYPAVEEIAANSEFILVQISKEEFESIWNENVEV